MMPLLASLVLLGAEPPATVYAVAIGNNAPPAGEALAPLRYADDDAVRFDHFFARFADHHELLSTLDLETQRRAPEAAARARPPTLSALRETFRSITESIAEDTRAGRRSVLYLTFSGHGAQAEDGSVYLSLADGPLTRQVLYDELLAPTHATVVHLVVDACHAEGVVGTRGLFAHERDATATPLSDAERAALSGHRLKDFPNVGVLMATTEQQQAHEWSAYQSGVFTHEVLSGLSGAADVNADGSVEYSELEAFIAAANRDVRDPRAMAQVRASPPPSEPHAALVQLRRLRDVAFLHGGFSALGHFFIELDDGERYLDAHLSGETWAQVALPRGRTVYVFAADQEARLDVEPKSASIGVAALRFGRRTAQARGALDQAFRAELFSSAYGATYYKGYVDSGSGLRVVFRANEVRDGPSTRKTLATASFVGAGVAVGVSAVFGALALVAWRDFESTQLQRSAALASQRFRQHSLVAGVSLGVALALGVTGAVLWPPARGPRLSLIPTASGALLSWSAPW